jgi:RNA polymerase sigma-70 factor (ECF subfamily)
VLQAEEVWCEENIELSTEEKLDLYHAIDHLKFPYKEIIIQHYFACNKLTEIAEMLDMPIGTVKAYHSKAKAKLREMMEVEV